MKGHREVAICLALSLAISAACSKETDNAALEEAAKAAESWIGIVDSGNYGESWDLSAELFRAALTRGEWDQALQGVRAPLGDMLNRAVASTQYATSLPGAPDGEYVVVQFTTEFANKKSAVETVTSMKDPDGIWRVSGYFIK